MKYIFKLCWMLAIVLLSGTVGQKASAQPRYSVSYQNFYDELSPYGQWIDYPQHGYVWSPRISNFRPYSTNGHWVFTNDYGWMWSSDYDWGWATFHYGRWIYDDFYGWLWTPGYEWSPAWVEWRSGGDYYGWAPLGPDFNFSSDYSFGRYSPPDYYWNFVPRRHICSSNMYNYYVPYSQNRTIIYNTTVLNNYNRTNNVFVTGPSRYEVERYTDRVTVYDLRQTSKPGKTVFERNTVNVYRPEVQQNSNDRRIAPRNFERYDKNKTVFDQRNDKTQNTIEQQNDLEARQLERARRVQELEQQKRSLYDRNRRSAQQENKAIDQQRTDNNVFDRRQQEQERLNAERRLQEQKQIEQQQRDNRNIFERRQQQLREQQEQRKVQQPQQSPFERRQQQPTRFEEQRKIVEQMQPQQKQSMFDRRIQQQKEKQQQ